MLAILYYAMKKAAPIRYAARRRERTPAIIERTPLIAVAISIEVMNNHAVEVNWQLIIEGNTRRLRRRYGN